MTNEASLSRLELLGISWIAVALFFLVLWLVERRTEDASLVDAGWSGSLGALAVVYGAFGGGLPLRRLLLAVLAGAWAARLTLHIVLRHRRGEEDGRYQEIRKNRGAGAHRFFFFFYQAQGLLALLLSIPFLLVAFDPAPRVSLWELVAAGLVVVGVVGESLADRQLALHRADPASRGKTCRSGLWRYSRHPNYFFEWLIWCGFGLAAAPAPYGWVALGIPLLMLFLILKVTGIPPTEERALRSRGEDYRRYQRTTSAFIPWFPKEPIEPAKEATT